MATSASTNGATEKHTGAVAVVELDAVPKMAELFADALAARLAAKHVRFVPNDAATTLKRRVREKHDAKIADPTRARRVERARRRKGQEMRHRYETVAAERDALAKRVRELERELTQRTTPKAPAKPRPSAGDDVPTLPDNA